MNAWLDVESGGSHTLAEVFGIRFKFVAKFRGCVQHSQHFECRSCDGRWKRVRKQIRPRTLPEHFDNFFPSRSKPTRRAAKCFAERRGDNIDAAHDVFMLDGTATRFDEMA